MENDCAVIAGDRDFANVRHSAWAQDIDFGLHVEQLLNANSEQLFGIKRPLDQSALGPYNGLDNTLSVIVATGLKSQMFPVQRIRCTT
jgi:hypothetical protein